MKLLILGLNYAPEKVGIAVYTTAMAEYLATAGHDVRVVASQPYYPAWKIMDGHSAWTYSRRFENGVDVTRVPHYIPAKPSGLKRVVHHASFAALALVPTVFRAASMRPDVVMTVGPSLIAAPIARLAAMVTGSRSWLHVQDFEVEAAFATGLLNKDNWRARLAAGFERYVLEGFDIVSSISPQMCRKLVEKGVAPEQAVEFRNWADVAAIKPLSEPSPYRAEWGITTPHVALYSGNIANKQGISIIVEAATQLKARQDLTFVICGEGPNRARLETLAAGLPNIQFRDLQPKDRLNDLLGLATIHLLPQLAGAADLVLPSKLIGMLASGRPIIATADAGTGIAAEVEGCGAIVAPGDASAFATAIVRFADDPATHAEAAAAARHRAEERWDGTAILNNLMFQLEVLVAGVPAVQASPENA